MELNTKLQNLMQEQKDNEAATLTIKHTFEIKLKELKNKQNTEDENSMHQHNQALDALRSKLLKDHIEEKDNLKKEYMKKKNVLENLQKKERKRNNMQHNEQEKLHAQQDKDLQHQLDEMSNKNDALNASLSKSKHDVDVLKKEMHNRIFTMDEQYQKANDALQIEKSEVEEILAALQASHAQMLQDIQAQTKAQADAETQRMKDAKEEKDSLRNETKQEHDRAEEEKAHAERLEQRLAELEQKLKDHEENEKNNTSNALVLGLVEKHEETLGSMKEEVAPAKVQQRRKSVQIQMTHVLELDTINFKVNTVTIVDESKNCVDTIAKILVDNPTIKVRVE